MAACRYSKSMAILPGNGSYFEFFGGELASTGWRKIELRAVVDRLATLKADQKNKC